MSSTCWCPRATTTVSPAPAGGLERRELLTEPLLLVTDTPREGPVELRTLADAPWIGGTEQFAGALDRAFRAAGFTPRIVHRADEATVFQALAAAGLGVCLLPALACTAAPGVHYARVTPEPPRRHIAALLRRGTASRPALAATLEALAGHTAVRRQPERRGPSLARDRSRLRGSRR